MAMNQPTLSAPERRVLFERIQTSPCPNERWWLLQHLARFQLPDEGDFYPVRRFVGRSKRTFS